MSVSALIQEVWGVTQRSDCNHSLNDDDDVQCAVLCIYSFNICSFLTVKAKQSVHVGGNGLDVWGVYSFNNVKICSQV